MLATAVTGQWLARHLPARSFPLFDSALFVELPGHVDAAVARDHVCLHVQRALTGVSCAGPRADELCSRVKLVIRIEGRPTGWRSRQDDVRSLQLTGRPGIEARPQNGGGKEGQQHEWSLLAAAPTAKGGLSSKKGCWHSGSD